MNEPLTDSEMTRYVDEPRRVDEPVQQHLADFHLASMKSSALKCHLGAYFACIFGFVIYGGVFLLHAHSCHNRVNYNASFADHVKLACSPNNNYTPPEETVVQRWVDCCSPWNGTGNAACFTSDASANDSATVGYSACCFLELPDILNNCRDDCGWRFADSLTRAALFLGGTAFALWWLIGRVIVMVRQSPTSCRHIWVVLFATFAFFVSGYALSPQVLWSQLQSNGYAAFASFGTVGVGEECFLAKQTLWGNGHRETLVLNQYFGALSSSIFVSCLLFFFVGFPLLLAQPCRCPTSATCASTSACMSTNRLGWLIIYGMVSCFGFVLRVCLNNGVRCAVSQPLEIARVYGSVCSRVVVGVCVAGGGRGEGGGGGTEACVSVDGADLSR
jgi:hypothetical protein